MRNQADMSIKQYSIEANIQIGFTELTEGLRAHLTVVEKEQGNVEANPIVKPPSVRRKKLSLRKSTRVRTVYIYNSLEKFTQWPSEALCC